MKLLIMQSSPSSRHFKQDTAFRRGHRLKVRHGTRSNIIMLPNFVKMHSVKHNETAFTILPSFAHGQTERDMDRLGR